MEVGQTLIAHPNTTVTISINQSDNEILEELMQLCGNKPDIDCTRDHVLYNFLTIQSNAELFKELM